MRAMVIDSAFRCIFLSEVDPTYKLRGRTPQNVTRTCATNWISENVDSWKKAANSCFTTRKPQHCEISCEIEGNRSRWRVPFQFIKRDRVLAQATKIPLHIHSLSTQEKEVLGQLAHSRSNVQIAKRLGITVSTVEKHHSKIRQTLGVSTDRDLQLAA